MSKGYAFGASDLKLGDRVEVMTTKQKGILISEVVHLSGCNTFQVLLPNVQGKEKGEMKVKHCDHLILRKLEDKEAVFGKKDNLTDENVFALKGTDVNAEWIKAATKAKKEPIPEVDEAVGVEELVIMPGMEVWHKIYNMPMLVSCVYREIYSKELEYCLTYMHEDKEFSVNARAWALVPMEHRINIYADANGKVGAVGDEILSCMGGISFD